MVGGEVVGMTIGKDQIRLVIQGTGTDKHREVVKTIRIKPPMPTIVIGDECWWQSRMLMFGRDKNEFTCEII
jgi:hypothetical protein